MKVKIGRMILSSPGLRNELWVAFGLILLSVIALIGYLFPGSSSYFQLRHSLPLIVFIGIFILLMSFIIMSQIVFPVITLSREAKRIADGDLSREIEIARKDEIGKLGESLNQMTHQIKDNLDELQALSQKTDSIKVEIDRRILVLSNLIEVSNFISQNTPLNQVLEFVINKCLESEAISLGCIFLKDWKSGKIVMEYLKGDKRDTLIQKGINVLEIHLGEGLLGKSILRQNALMIDRDTSVTQEIAEFRSLFSLTNAIIAPISSRGNTFGLLIIGNEQGEFQFSKSEAELLELVTKQISIAILNDILSREVEQLSAVDSLTGLYNQVYINKKLGEAVRLAIGSQQPCSFIILNIDHFEKYQESYGQAESDNVLKKIAEVLKVYQDHEVKAARLDDHEFAVILPNKSKKVSIKFAEELKVSLDQIFSREKDPHKKLTCSLAISENPIDGKTAGELIKKGRDILKEAIRQGGNRVSYKL